MKNHLKQIRVSQGFSQADVARDLDMSVGTYRSYEQGTRGLNGEKLMTFARYFKVSTDSILGLEVFDPDMMDALTHDEEQLIRSFRALGDVERRITLDIVDYFVSRRGGMDRTDSISNRTSSISF